MLWCSVLGNTGTILHGCSSCAAWCALASTSCSDASHASVARRGFRYEVSSSAGALQAVIAESYLFRLNFSSMRVRATCGGKACLEVTNGDERFTLTQKEVSDGLVTICFDASGWTFVTETFSVKWSCAGTGPGNNSFESSYSAGRQPSVPRECCKGKNPRVLAGSIGKL
jgi:hypothetical protein